MKHWVAAVVLRFSQVSVCFFQQMRWIGEEHTEVLIQKLQMNVAVIFIIAIFTE